MIFLLCISVASLPFRTGFVNARAVTSASGQGAILQSREHLYELSYEENSFQWTILPQKLSKGVSGAVMMTLPDDYTC